MVTWFESVIQSNMLERKKKLWIEINCVNKSYNFVHTQKRLLLSSIEKLAHNRDDTWFEGLSSLTAKILLVFADFSNTIRASLVFIRFFFKRWPWKIPQLLSYDSTYFNICNYFSSAQRKSVKVNFIVIFYLNYFFKWA